MSSQPIPILLYHAVSERSDPRFAEWTVAPSDFADQMLHLADRGYRSMTVREFVQRAYEMHEPIDARAVVITFDDGFADFHAHAWPTLRALDLTATIYVATGYVGQTSRWLQHQGEADRPMLTWSQIEELAESGIEIGSHSHGHPQLDGVSTSKARAEIARSRAALQFRIGPITSFAYPHGYYNRDLQRQVARAGFSSACAVKDALSSTEDDRFALARAVVRGGMMLDDFERILHGEGLPVAPGPRALRRGAWRMARRAGAGPFFERLRAGRAVARIRGDP